MWLDGEMMGFRNDFEALRNMSFSRVLKERDSFSTSARTVLSFEVGTRKGFFDGEFARIAASNSF